ncbi:GerMN domain-containing protein [Clostridium nigeriense]|uniref:GerMN domain-containing protein n=1 Tax=Clostridium nigeriense TaxID=1805470 RepID=UPI003D33DE9D
MKRKLFLILFTLIFSFILIGCSKSKENSPSKDSSIQNENIEEDYNKDNINIDKSKDNTSKDTRKVRLFYFDTVNYKVFYVDKEIEVIDKAIIKSLTKELQNYSPNENFLNLTDKVEITSATLDEKTGVLKIVFSSSYVDKMLLGSATESGLLSSLISTYGYNLNVNKISIYFGDDLYTSLRGDLPNGYFDVNYDSSIAYSKENYDTDTTTTSTNIKTLNCRIYYYSVTDDVFYYKDKVVEVIDGALVTALTKEMINIPNNTFFNFGDDLAIISAKLNDDSLTIDLSDTYYNLLTRVGSGSEASALKTLALTYGYNYNVTKVIILVDGSPYKGSHIMYDTNEAISTNVTNIKEYK